MSAKRALSRRIFRAFSTAVCRQAAEYYSRDGKLRYYPLALPMVHYPLAPLPLVPTRWSKGTNSGSSLPAYRNWSDTSWLLYSRSAA